MKAPILRVILQRGENDCGVAALAMLLGVTYEESLIAISSVEPEVLSRGVWTKHIVAAALKLGYALRRKRRYDMETDTGLLNLSSKRWCAEHVIVLSEGILVETDGTIWEPETYFAVNKAKPGMLLVAESKGYNEQSARR